MSAVSGASGYSDSPSPQKTIGQKRRFQELQRMVEEDSDAEDKIDSRPVKRQKRQIQESPQEVKDRKYESGSEEEYVAGKTVIAAEQLAQNPGE